MAMKVQYTALFRAGNPGDCARRPGSPRVEVVGDSGLEPLTSAMSTLRSNQLS